MYEIDIVCYNKHTRMVCANDLVFTRDKKLAQKICDEKNANCDDDHYWIVGACTYID